MNDKDSKEQFWKELMGEIPENLRDEPESEEKPKANDSDTGFTIEYISRDGETVREEDTLPKKPPEPDKQKQEKKPQIPVEYIKRPEEPVKRPENQKPAQQEKKTSSPGNGTGDRLSRPAQNAGKQGTTKTGRSDTGNKQKEFEVDFDFDKEYEDVYEKPVRRGRSKRTGCISGILYFLLIICVSAVLACLGWMAATDVLGLGEEDKEVNITIPREIFTSETREEKNDSGETVKKNVNTADIDYVTDLLYENGLVRYKWIFKLFAEFASADEKITAGTYVLNTNFDYRALIKGMNPSSGERLTIDVTIPEGYNVYQIVAFLVSKDVCREDELWETMANYDFKYDFLEDTKLGDKTRLEGYLFPDTYTFYVGDTPSRVINKMLANFKNKWTDSLQEKADKLGYTQREILTVASMIEKEAGVEADRANIASVIYNRLRDNNGGTYGYLQIDATIYYAIAGTDKEFSKDIDSPYNTYLYPGLTPGPIANPGMASIKAALNPENTKYYYYALGNDHSHRFFYTYEEHQAFVQSSEYGGK